MMTSIYHPSGPHSAQYFRDSPVLYSGSKLMVKQEPAEENMEVERPVDMSLAAREAKGHRHHQNGLNSEAIRADVSHFYGAYIHPHHHQNHLMPHQNPSPMSNNHPEQIQSPSLDLESCPTSISPPTNSSEMDNFHLKGSNGKLTVPAALNNNGRLPAFRPVDLLPVTTHQRAKREFVPDNKKDENYWSKRLKNNDSARRSRVKRKALEKMMESKLLELQKENIQLKHEVAALKRRFGVEETNQCSEDVCSPLEQEDRGSPPLPSSSPEENGDKQSEDLERQSSGSDDSRSNDDSRVYTVSSVTALNHALGPAGRDRRDSMGSNSSSLNSSRISTSSRPNSRNSQSGSVDMAIRTDVTGALDLTSDHSNRSTPGWESSSPESFNGNSAHSNRRYSCVSSDSSSMEDSANRTLKAFPLKCRWKKEMHSAHNPATEELQ